MPKSWKAITPILVWLVLILFSVLFGIPTGLTANAWYYFAVFAAVIVGLILEPVPGGAIALTGIIAISLLGYISRDPNQSLAWALSGFSDSTVWLIFGAFIFSMGYNKTGLGHRIALILVRRLGGSTLGLGYAIALADLVLAPGTPSNTARSGGTIFPIISNIPGLYGSAPGPTARKIGSYIMWTAFASMCVTSSLFLTALTPNAVAVSILKSDAKLEINWFEWLQGFLPVGIVLLFLVPILVYYLYPPEIKASKEVTVWADAELKKMGKVSRREWMMLAFVSFTVLLWVIGANSSIGLPYLGSNFINPTMVVLIAIALMVLTDVVSWNDILSNAGAWNVLIWFATLLTLANGLNKVGFIDWFGNLASAPLRGLPPLIAMALLVSLFFLIHYFFASLTAHTAAVFPVILKVGMDIPGIPVIPFALLLGYSLGLMGVITPYATGPAAIYYGSGYISRTDFWKLGLIFGLLFLGLLLGMGMPYLLWLKA